MIRGWGTGALVLGALGAGIFVGLFIPTSKDGGFPTLREEREYGENYTFISPLLSCGEGEFNHLGNDETIQLEEQLETFVEGLKSQKKVTDVGIYFRELNGGPWVGINFEAKFTPGSLLKVPLAMSVYQLSESDQGLLSKEIEYEGGTAIGEQHFTAPVVAPGVYTVEELIEAMLTNSDNNAAALLAQIIGKQNLDYSYSHLGIETPETGNDYETSVRTYSSFFRILYNATYLDRTYSEKLLELLSKSVFTEGIVAGVPEGIKVAHKFGERAYTGEKLSQLHDCGIVYHPKQPYLLCVMMRGENIDTLAGAIRDVSRLVYTYAN